MESALRPPPNPAESLVEDRVAQLRLIAHRRNALLRQMHRMIHRRNGVASLLPHPDDDDDTDADDLAAFLNRFRMSPTDPHLGSIASLQDTELFAAISSQTLPDDRPTASASFSQDQHPALADSAAPSPLSQASDEDYDQLNLPRKITSIAQPVASPVGDCLLPLSGVHNQALPSNDDMDVDVSGLPTRSVSTSEVTQGLNREESTNPQDVVMRHEEYGSQGQEREVPLNPPSCSRTVASGSHPLSLMSLKHIPVTKKFILVPAPSHPLPFTQDFTFGESTLAPPSSLPSAPSQPRHHIKAGYTLPPSKYFNLDSFKKSKSAKKKRDRDREKHDGRKETDWASLGLNKWIATISANPVWKRVSRSQKCLMTREWAVAMTELRLVRAVERVDLLKREGRWSFRQPKKQRGIGGLMKTHWDYLLDEMKWMRIDFREERKWKMAIAYNLSTSVLEWHVAGSQEARLANGICVRWNRYLVDPGIPEDDMEGAQEDPGIPMDVGEASEETNASLLAVEYGSDDVGDEEPTKSTELVVDSLEPAEVIKEALDNPIPGAGLLQEVLSNNQLKTELDDGHSQPREIQVGDEDQITDDLQDMKPTVTEIGLKATSNDPTLGFNPTPSSSGGDEPESSLVPLKPSSKINTYSPLRQLIAGSDENKLFLDYDDLSLIRDSKSASDAESPPSDLMSLFPEFTLYTVLDVAPVAQPSTGEGKRKSEKRSDRDDPQKRTEETTYTRLFPASEFTLCKPTLLGPLRPSKNWKNNQWVPSEEPLSISDIENPTKISEERINELFDSRSRDAPSVLIQIQLQAAFLRDKDSRRRNADHHWSTADDNLLKTLVDKYPYNWPLIAECFNASRLTISTDYRIPRDCLDRWRDRWGPGPDHRRPQDAQTFADDSSTPASSSMTTRGIKRLASASISGSGASTVNTANEQPKKRRRHVLIQDTIRKANKKRNDALQKQLAAQRKPPAVHETHAQISKLPKRTPAELSRMKAEKEARDAQEQQMARKRQEEMTRSNFSQRLNGSVPGAQAQSQAPPQPGTNSVQRPMPVMRNQVNISQQQRMGTPVLPAANRGSPQQIVQVQVRGAAQATDGLSNSGISQGQVNGAPPLPLNSNGQASGQFSPSFPARENMMSPALTGQASPAGAASSPRPLSAQAHTLLQGGGTRAGYYMPNVPGYTTTEQIHTALRLQQQQQQQQQQQGPPQPQPVGGQSPAGS